MSTLPTIQRRRREEGPSRGLNLRLLFFLVSGLVSGWGFPGEATAQRLSTPSAIRPAPTGRGKHCLGEAVNKTTLEHTVAGSINPLGIGNSLRLGWCTPLIKKPGLLFDFTNFDVGVLMMNSPTDTHLGVQMFLAPLSILVLRAEATAFYIWPTPLQGAGFITVNSPSEFTLARLSPDPTGWNHNPPDGQPEGPVTPASTAFGGRVMIGATLQGQIPIVSKLDIQAAIGANAEYWSVTSPALSSVAPGGGFYAARRDVILLGSADWVIASTAALLFSIKPHYNLNLKLGGFNDLVYVPSHGYLGNIAGGLLVLNVPNLRFLAKSFNFFFRAGTFTHHAFRVGGGLTIAGGVNIIYELSPSPPPLPPPASSQAPAVTPASTTISDAPPATTAAPPAPASAGDPGTPTYGVPPAVLDPTPVPPPPSAGR
ncbi:MAG TPA: hypothetical protein PKI03_30975 [Pseudomonadota bacterium]|nr:hypothetical protein [Pseudomonadota bacterium]